MALKVLFDRGEEFLNRVGTLDFEDFIGMDLQPDFGDALFTPKSLPRLKEFVSCNSGYHIVSCEPGFMINRFVEGMRLYMLAWGGDQDPELAFIRTQHFWRRVEFKMTGGRSSAKVS